MKAKDGVHSSYMSWLHRSTAFSESRHSTNDVEFPFIV